MIQALPQRVQINISQKRQYPQEKNQGKGQKKKIFSPVGHLRPGPQQFRQFGDFLFLQRRGGDGLQGVGGPLRFHSFLL